MDAASLHVTPTLAEGFGRGGPRFICLDAFTEGVHQAQQQRAVPRRRALDLGMEPFGDVVGVCCHGADCSTSDLVLRRLSLFHPIPHTGYGLGGDRGTGDLRASISPGTLGVSFFSRSERAIVDLGAVADVHTGGDDRAFLHDHAVHDH